MKDKIKIRIPSTGGLFTTQDLRELVKTAIYYGVKEFYASDRQEFFFYVDKDKHFNVLKKILEKEILVETDDQVRNIVSSLTSVNVFPGKSWIKSGTYLDIINSFGLHPKLKIGLVDPEQELIPLMSNQLNFIASDEPDYWYLYLCLKKDSKPFLWPVKVDTQSIYQLCKQIGGMVLGDQIASETELVGLINDNINYSYLSFSEVPKFKTYVMPSYDGLHSVNNDYWLGITQQQNKFSTSFLESMLFVCQKQNLNNVYLSTWGSILIRHIQKGNVDQWNYLLNDFSINTGHAYSELNWLMADIDDRARELKRKVVSHFYKKNARTEGLVFGIDTGKQEIFPNVLIKEIPSLTAIGWYKYDVSYAKRFDANTREYIPYRQRVSKSELNTVLYELCKLYMKQFSFPEKEENKTSLTKVNMQKQEFHQCKNCLTVYDPQYGNEEANILPGTLFEDLPEDYECELCGSSKEFFILGEISNE